MMDFHSQQKDINSCIKKNTRYVFVYTVLQNGPIVFVNSASFSKQKSKRKRKNIFDNHIHCSAGVKVFHTLVPTTR